MFSPLTNALIGLTDMVLLLAYTAFTVASVVILDFRNRGSRASPWIYVVWRLTKWPALVGVIGSSVATYYLVTADPVSLPLSVLGSAFGAWVWWQYRNVGDDDDTMKRLRDRLKARVEQFGSKLVVVPEPA